WNEMAQRHLDSPGYSTAQFRKGEIILDPIVREKIGNVRGRKLLHLQCHFGLDTLSLARRGAAVTGLDFSAPAIVAARDLAAETGLTARFVESNVYEAHAAIADRFDIVYVTWGAISWLNDIRRWAAVAAVFLAPGGFLY